MTFYSERVELENVRYFARLRGWREPFFSLCPTCKGEGEVELTCERCRGKGEIECCCPECHDYHTAMCRDCDGEGKVYALCPACGGEGYYDATLERHRPDTRTLPLFAQDELREAG